MKRIGLIILLLVMLLGLLVSQVSATTIPVILSVTPSFWGYPGWVSYGSSGSYFAYIEWTPDTYTTFQQLANPFNGDAEYYYVANVTVYSVTITTAPRADGYPRGSYACDDNYKLPHVSVYSNNTFSIGYDSATWAAQHHLDCGSTTRGAEWTITEINGIPVGQASTPMPSHTAACRPATAVPTATIAPTNTPLDWQTTATHTPNGTITETATVAWPTNLKTATPSPTPSNTTGPSPTPTQTGAPSATSSVTPWPTSELSMDSGVAMFIGSLEDWNTGSAPPADDALTVSGWRSWPGPDGIGVAAIGDSHNRSYYDMGTQIRDNASPGDPFYSYLYDTYLEDALIYSYPLGFPSPVRLSGQAAYSGTVPTDVIVYLTYAFFVREEYHTLPPYTDTIPAASWWIYYPGSIRIDAEWNEFDWNIALPPTNTVTALAIVWWSEFADGSGRYDYNTLKDLGGPVLIDDARVIAGANAAASYPVCPLSGADNPLGSVETKLCPVVRNSVEIDTGCTEPDSLLDVVGWLSYWFCRLWSYFKWFPANTTQLTDLTARQSTVEPIGSILELGDVYQVFAAVVESLLDVYARGTWSYRTIDFSQLLDWHALDEPVQFDLTTSQDTYLDECPATIIGISEGTQASACFVVGIVRRKSLVIALAQWGMDVLVVLAVIGYFRKVWMAKND